MRFFLQALVGRFDIAPGQMSAFGAAVGGLFALVVVNVFGMPTLHVTSGTPTVSNLTTLSVGGLVMIAAQIVGALVAWGRATART